MSSILFDPELYPWLDGLEAICAEDTADPTAGGYQGKIGGFTMPLPKEPKIRKTTLEELIRKAWMYDPAAVVSHSDSGCQFGPDDPTQPIDIDEPWDDWEHLDMCDRCEGSGFYDPFVGPRQACDKCDGSKWVGKGEGLSKEQAQKLGKA